MTPSWQPARHLTSDLSIVAASGTLMTMRRVVDAEWEPTVPALVQLVAASGAPHLRAAFAAAGLDGIRPAQSAVLVPLAAGALHASDLADRFRVSRQAVAQAIAALERHGYVTRVPDPADARARLIELTPRGRQALRVMRSHALDLEKRWQKTLGQRSTGGTAHDIADVARSGIRHDYLDGMEERLALINRRLGAARTTGPGVVGSARRSVSDVRQRRGPGATGRRRARRSCLPRPVRQRYRRDQAVARDHRR